MNDIRLAKFNVGQVVRHRLFAFRGVIFDVDPVFDNTEEWYQSIPEDVRPSKDQPFYHLLAENEETEYVAYGLRADEDSDENTKTNITEMEASFIEAISKLEELGEVQQDNWGRWIWTKTGKPVGSTQDQY